MAEQTISIGRIVHFVMPDGSSRPAIVVALEGAPPLCNLSVFTDGPNDCNPASPNLYEQERSGSTSMVWRRNVDFDPSESPKPRTWHWPPRT